MNIAKAVEQNLDDFLRTTIELANFGENEALSDKNQAIILLNALPNSFKEVKLTIKYGRTTITLKEVISVLRSRDLEIKTEKQRSSSSENYFVRGGVNKKKII